MFLGSLMMTGIFLIRKNTVNYRETQQISGDDSINERIDGKMIIWGKGIIPELNKVYRTSTVERAFCLKGDSFEDKILIKNVVELKTKEKGTPNQLNVDHDAIRECKSINGDKLLGILHFHLNEAHGLFEQLCKMSINDAFSFGVWADLYDVEINAIQCGEGKFFIIDQTNQYQSLRWGAIG